MKPFQYYYGSDAENFNFFRLPKKLIRDKKFRSLSSDAKILYGILLDRMTLSGKNGWLDEKNRIYIIFTIQDIAEEMYCSQRKAIQLMNELDGIGLIERKRRGMGRPNIIYVKNFNTADKHPEIEKTIGAKNNKEKDGGSAAYQEVQEHAYQEVQEHAYQEVQECAHQEVQERAHQGVQKRAYQQVQKCAPQNDTDMNDTKYIYNNLSIHPSEYTTEGWMDRELVKHILETKLGYKRMTHDSPDDEAQIREIIDLLADVCCYTDDSLLINGNSVPIRNIRQRFMSLNSEHLRYVLDKLKQNTAKVKNIRSYLLTCLYNAPVTMQSYYQSEVQHDMTNSEVI